MGIYWDQMIPGQTYKIHTIIGAQILPREHVMSFLGMNPGHDSEHEGKSSSWNARPAAGTTEIFEKQIIAMWLVQNDTERYVNRVVQPETRVF